MSANMIEDLAPVSMETNQDDLNSCDSNKNDMECACDQDDENACDQDEKSSCDSERQCDCDSDEECDCDSDEELDCVSDEECDCVSDDECEFLPDLLDSDVIDAAENDTYNFLFFSKKSIDTSNLIRTDLKTCCSPGELCCLRCAYNLEVYRSSEKIHFVFAHVKSGATPVGHICTRNPCKNLRRKILAAGLELLVDGVQNRWGTYMYYFARSDIADKSFSDFVDLDALRLITNTELPDQRIRDYVVDPAFYNETGSILARGIVQGFPMWYTIAWFFQIQFSSVKAVAKIEPEVMCLLEDCIDIKNIFRTDMGICCPPGKVCCPRCAYNFRFRGGSPYHCLGDDELIDRVASGLKPVGSTGASKPSKKMRSRILAAGLEILVDGFKNRVGNYMYYFARPDNANKMFSDFINLAAVEEITGKKLSDCRIRDHVVDPAFLNETDSILARGIVYGFPLWSSIALFL